MSKHTTTLNEYINGELMRMDKDEFINNGKLTIFDDEFQFIQKIIKFDDDVYKIVNEKIFKNLKFEDEKVDKHFKKSFITRFLDREINRQTIEAFTSQVVYITLTHEEYINTVFGSEFYKYLEQHVDFNNDYVGNTIENSTEHGETKQTQDSNTKDNYSDTSNTTHSETTNGKGGSTDDNRSANATLPQSEVNINVDNTNLNYADENNISRNKNTNFNDTDTSGKSETKSSGNRNSDYTGLTDGLSDSERNAQSDNTSNTKSLTKSYLLDNLKTIYDMKEQMFLTHMVGG